MKKFDSNFGRFDTSTWQTPHDSEDRAGLRRAVNIYAFSHYVVLYSTLKRLFGLIQREKKKKD